VPTLLESHRRQLDDSGLTDEIILLRKYRSILEPHELRALDFSEVQSFKVPCLGIPLWDVDGRQALWQIRPDRPDLDLRSGRPKKYLTPHRSRMMLDIHPVMQPLLSDPGVRLWITEGVKKGDSLAAHGECAIALVGGVWGWRGGNSKGGKTALADWQSVALNGRDVYIAYDNDVMRKDAVRSALEALFAFLQSKEAIPHLILLPESDDKVGVDDFLASGHTIDDLLACEGKRLPAPEHAPNLRPGLPIIAQHPFDLALVAEQGIKALSTMPGAPHLFQRAQMLCHITPEAPKIPGVKYPEGTPSIQPVSVTKLRQYLAQAANWTSPNKTGTKAYPDKPASWLVETVMTDGEWRDIPPLLGIVSTPNLRPDGTIITANGYDAHTGLYLKLNTQFPQVPESPTYADVQAAIARLFDPFSEFPFKNESSKSTLIAAILTLIARYTVGNVPLFAIRSTTAGSGKSKIANGISLIVTGRMAATLPQVKEEDEERKRLLAIAIQGDPMMLIDNVNQDFGNAAIDMAITSRIYKDRLLGRNDVTKEAPMYAVLFITGNNIAFRGDTVRRVVTIDLEPEEEHPEERKDFRYPKLEEHLKSHHAQLATDALTILRGYAVAGYPKSHLDPYGSFEEWSDLIRECLVWCGWEDPLANKEERATIQDLDADLHRELLDAWDACYPDRDAWHTLRQVNADIQLYPADHPEWSRLRDALGAYERQFDGKRLNITTIGKALGRIEGRIRNGRRLRMGKKTMHGIIWRVETTHAKAYESTKTHDNEVPF